MAYRESYARETTCCGYMEEPHEEEGHTLLMDPLERY